MSFNDQRAAAPSSGLPESVQGSEQELLRNFLKRFCNPSQAEQISHELEGNSQSNENPSNVLRLSPNPSPSAFTESRRVSITRSRSEISVLSATHHSSSVKSPRSPSQSRSRNSAFSVVSKPGDTRRLLAEGLSPLISAGPSIDERVQSLNLNDPVQQQQLPKSYSSPQYHTQVRPPAVSALSSAFHGASAFSLHDTAASSPLAPTKSQLQQQPPPQPQPAAAVQPQPQQLQPVAAAAAAAASAPRVNSLAMSPSRLLQQFECDTCQDRFVTPRELAMHRRKLHSGLASFVCTRCPTHTNFSSRANLKRHTDGIHECKRSFVCETCGKGFPVSCSLTRHRRVHSGEKPYKCEHCSMAFSDSGNLRKHVRIHTGEKPFHCQICQHRFADSSHFRRHCRSHQALLQVEMATEQEAAMSTEPPSSS